MFSPNREVRAATGVLDLLKTEYGTDGGEQAALIARIAAFVLSRADDPAVVRDLFIKALDQGLAELRQMGKLQ